MRALLFTMVLCGTLLPLAGCESVGDTAAENRVRISHAMIIDMKQITNDTEYLLYVDRPVWLSRYPIPND